MVYRNNAGWLGFWLHLRGLETRWLSQKSWFPCPGILLYNKQKNSVNLIESMFGTDYVNISSPVEPLFLHLSLNISGSFSPVWTLLPFWSFFYLLQRIKREVYLRSEEGRRYRCYERQRAKSLRILKPLTHKVDRRKVVSKWEGSREGVDATRLWHTRRYFSLSDLTSGWGLLR